MAEKELVLELGVEGGEATIYRKVVGSEDWQFHVEGSSMFLDENDDEDWRSWTSLPVPTIRDALCSIAEDGSWVFFHPISIHPEYRKVVWEMAQEIASKLPAEGTEMWENRHRHWQRLCLEK